MADQAATSATGYKNNSGVFLGGGSAGARMAILTVIKNQTPPVGLVKVPAAGLSNSGTGSAPISGGNYAKSVAGQYIIAGFSTKVAGLTDNTLKSGAAEFLNHSNRHCNNMSTSTRRYHITSWNFATGAPTYGGSRGASTSFNADHEASSPFGELSYMNGSKNPVSADYGHSF